MKKVKDKYNFYSMRCNHGRFFTAKIIDFLTISIVVSILILFLGIIITESPLVSIFISTMFLILFITLFYRRFQGEYRKLRDLTYKKVQVEKIQSQLESISLDNFQSLLSDLLLECKLFSNVVVGKHMIEGISSNIRCAIGYDVTNSQELTSWETVKSFINSIEQKKYERIMFFTNSQFEEKCYDLKASISCSEIHLIERDHIIKLLTDFNITPNDDNLDETIEEEYNSIKRVNKARKRNFGSVKGAKYLILYSFIFACASFITRSYLVYYLIISAVFLILAIIIFLLNLKKGKPPSNCSDINRDIEP